MSHCQTVSWYLCQYRLLCLSAWTIATKTFSNHPAVLPWLLHGSFCLSDNLNVGPVNRGSDGERTYYTACYSWSAYVLVVTHDCTLTRMLYTYKWQIQFMIRTTFSLLVYTNDHTSIDVNVVFVLVVSSCQQHTINWPGCHYSGTISWDSINGSISYRLVSGCSDLSKFVVSIQIHVWQCRRMIMPDWMTSWTSTPVDRHNSRLCYSYFMCRSFK